MNRNEKIGWWIIILISLGTLVALLIHGAIPQSLSYHAFVALLSIIIGEFISPRTGSILLVPLVALGILSVLYWHWTETAGHGDLRPYILVQFLPMLVIPVILVCFKSACTHAGSYWILFSAYAAAKVFEHFDREIYAMLGFVSGHSLKHIVAAIGVYFLLVSFGGRSCT